jgi:hypothetical protein
MEDNLPWRLNLVSQDRIPLTWLFEGKFEIFAGTKTTDWRERDKFLKAEYQAVGLKNWNREVRLWRAAHYYKGASSVKGLIFLVQKSNCVETWLVQDVFEDHWSPFKWNSHTLDEDMLSIFKTAMCNLMIWCKQGTTGRLVTSKGISVQGFRGYHWPTYGRKHYFGPMHMHLSIQ